jgi:hypothetical protein
MDDRDNGILGTVPGAVIGAASQLLPPADQVAGPDSQVTLNAGWLGAVRITFTRQRIKHGRSTKWIWVAVHAEKAPSAP